MMGDQLAAFRADAIDVSPKVAATVRAEAATMPVATPDNAHQAKAWNQHEQAPEECRPKGDVRGRLGPHAQRRCHT